MPNKPTQNQFPHTGMAYRYECAWNKIVMDASKWERSQIINDPFGQYANRAANRAAKLAEKDNKPILTGINNN